MLEVLAVAPVFQTAILNWYQAFGRKDLPWQQPQTPYRVWISEIMLQQTQVQTVIGFFERFMQSFPSIKHLSQATLDQVLQHWAGLGYYARARNLHKTAQTIQINSGDSLDLPRTLKELVALPGIGPSTAGAILSLGHGISAAILDGNVKRVLARYFNLSIPFDTHAGQKIFWEYSTQLTPKIGSKARHYNQAMMDLGAMVCHVKNPNCTACPLAKLNNHLQCQSFKLNNWSEFPVKKKNIIKKREFWELHLHVKKGQLLLEKRLSPGIWGSLWCPPIQILKSQQLSQTKHQPNDKNMTIIPHELTHKSLILIPVLKPPIRPRSSNQAWFDIQALKQKTIGLPRPIQKLVDTL
ncbi:MAG: A/G-specific adenine glycosylase [Gammaproteobacteria bacterium]